MTGPQLGLGIHSGLTHFYLFLSFIYCILVCMSILLVCMSVHQYLKRSEESLGSPENEVKDSCEPPCRCLELNPGPFQEQKTLLIIAEPCLWTPALPCLWMALNMYIHFYLQK